MRTMIVAGGELSPAFLKERIEAEEPEFLIAADRGLDVLLLLSGEDPAHPIVPDLLLGDFDSTRLVNPLDLHSLGIQYEVYPAEKDFSDLESAIRTALQRGSSQISILGATGGRMDHFLANVMNLQIPLRAGIPAWIEDEQNRIYLKDRSFTVSRSSCFGKYLSLLSLFQESTQVCLRGFKYSGEKICLSRVWASYGVSNEIVEEKAEVIFRDAVLAVIESKDG